MSFPTALLGAYLREPLRNGKSARASANGEGVRVFTLTAVTEGDFSEKNTKVSVLRPEDAEDVWAEPGDIYIERSNTPELVGTAALYTGRRRFAVFPDLLIRVRPDERLDGRFLVHFLRSELARRYFRSNARGIAGTMPKISQQVIEAIRVPVPDRREQDRIVAAIETHFSRLDAAVASLTRARANVKRARASVLKAAVEGRLVPTEAALAHAEGREYEPAGVLLERILAERKAAWVSRKDAKAQRERYKEPVKPETEGLPRLPEGWCWASVDAVTLVSGGITKNAGRAKRDCLVPYLRVANVYADDLRLDDVASITVSEAELTRLLLQRGDLLIVEGNGSADQLGRVAVWNGSISPCIHQNHLIKARPLRGVSERWLLHWMLSPGGRRAIQSVASSTSGLHTLSISKVQALPVMIPPLAEQHRIVAEVDRRLSVLDALDATLDANLARCARLRQAILKRAFEGRLVPAEADPPLLAAEPQMPLFARDARS